MTKHPLPSVMPITSNKRGLSVLEILIGCLFLLGGGIFFFRALDSARLKRTQTSRRALAQHLAINLAHIARTQTGNSFEISTEAWKSNADFIKRIEIQSEGKTRSIQVDYTVEGSREETLNWEIIVK